MEGNCGGSILINHLQLGQGRDVIFLHGWGGDIRSFLGCAREISDNFRVTLVDFYGFGKTPFPPYPLFLDDYVDSVVKLIEYYGMHDVIIVGHSFGGRVALRLASKFGFLLDRIVIVDGAGVKPRRSIKYYVKVGFHKLMKGLKINHVGGSADYRKLNADMRRTFINIVNEHQNSELKKITLPTLLVWGDKDRATPIYMARRMYRDIVSSSLVIFKGGGHFVYVERHRAFTNILKKFISGGDYEVGDSRAYGDICKRSIIKIPCLRSKKQL